MGLTYRCIARPGAQFPVDPRGVMKNPDGSGVTSLMHYYLEGDELRSPNSFYPLPCEDATKAGPHGVVNRCFACSDEAIEAQRQELWKREDEEAEMRDREEILKRERNTPTMQMMERNAKMNADAFSEAVKSIASTMQPVISQQVPESKEDAGEPKKEHWKQRRKRLQEESAETETAGVSE